MNSNNIYNLCCLKRKDEIKKVKIATSTPRQYSNYIRTYKPFIKYHSECCEITL